MLTIFKSPFSGDVVMFSQNAKEILGIIGKQSDASAGVITPEQLPGAISALEAAIDADKKKSQTEGVENTDRPDTVTDEVRLYQRALPLFEMLQRSRKENVPVTWGV